MSIWSPTFKPASAAAPPGVTTSTVGKSEPSWLNPNVPQGCKVMRWYKIGPTLKIAKPAEMMTAAAACLGDRVKSDSRSVMIGASFIARLSKQGSAVPFAG